MSLFYFENRFKEALKDIDYIEVNFRQCDNVSGANELKSSIDEKQQELEEIVSSAKKFVNDPSNGHFGNIDDFRSVIEKWHRRSLAVKENAEIQFRNCINRIEVRTNRERLFENIRKKPQSDSFQMIQLENEYKSGLKNSNVYMNRVIDASATLLDELKTQRGFLKKIGKTISNITSKLSMSYSLTKMINRRGKQDRILFKCLAIVFICFIIWYWYKYK